MEVGETIITTMPNGRVTRRPDSTARRLPWPALAQTLGDLHRLGYLGTRQEVEPSERDGRSLKCLTGGAIHLTAAHQIDWPGRPGTEITLKFSQRAADNGDTQGLENKLFLATAPSRKRL